MPSVIAVARDVEGAAEDAGEGQHVVDLVREVDAAGGDDPGVPAGDVRVAPRGRVGQREDDRVRAPSRRRLLGDGAAGHADVDVGAAQRVGERPEPVEAGRRCRAASAA